MDKVAIKEQSALLEKQDLLGVVEQQVLEVQVVMAVQREIKEGLVLKVNPETLERKEGIPVVMYTRVAKGKMEEGYGWI